jgi:hypothetical protein
MHIRPQVHVNLSGLYYLSMAANSLMMACKTGPRRRNMKDEPIQYVPAEEKKTVIESPERTEPKRGKEGGKPTKVKDIF